MTSNFNFEEGTYYFLSTKLNDSVSSYGFLIHIKNIRIVDPTYKVDKIGDIFIENLSAIFDDKYKMIV